MGEPAYHVKKAEQDDGSQASVFTWGWKAVLPPLPGPTEA